MRLNNRKENDCSPIYRKRTVKCGDQRRTLQHPLKLESKRSMAG